MRSCFKRESCAAKCVGARVSECESVCPCVRARPCPAMVLRAVRRAAGLVRPEPRASSARLQGWRPGSSPWGPCWARGGAASPQSRTTWAGRAGGGARGGAGLRAAGSGDAALRPEDPPTRSAEPAAGSPGPEVKLRSPWGRDLFRGSRGRSGTGPGPGVLQPSGHPSAGICPWVATGRRAVLTWVSDRGWGRRSREGRLMGSGRAVRMPPPPHMLEPRRRAGSAAWCALMEVRAAAGGWVLLPPRLPASVLREPRGEGAGGRSGSIPGSGSQETGQGSSAPHARGWAHGVPEKKGEVGESAALVPFLTRVW